MQGFLSPYTRLACIARTQAEPPLPKQSGQDALTRVLETEGDDDAVTRRMQFQMKKKKKDKKKDAKDAKQEQKKQKQQAREEKRKEKERVKEQKACAKKRKLEEKQSKQSQQDVPAKKNKEDQCAKKGIKRSHKDHSEKSPKPKAHWKKKGSQKRSKLLKFKKAAAAKRCKHKTKKTKNTQETEQSSSMQQSAEPGAVKINNESEPKAKQTVQGDNTQSKTRNKGENAKTKVSKKNSVQPCQETVKDLQDILCECKKSHCTHPNWKYPAIPKSFALSVYWSRQSVGVKMDDVGGRKVKRKQVAYFSGETPCIYTNIALAYRYVTWSPF